MLDSGLWCRSSYWHYVYIYCYALAILLYTFISFPLGMVQKETRREMVIRVEVCASIIVRVIPWELACFSLLFRATC